MMTITNRIRACTCGCQGRDPWHARTFDRTIQGITDEQGSCRVTAFKEPQTYIRTGWAKFPWSDEPVKVVEAVFEGMTMGWFIAREG